MAAKTFFLFKVRGAGAGAGAGAAFEIYCWSRSRIISGRLRFPGLYNTAFFQKGLGQDWHFVVLLLLSCSFARRNKFRSPLTGNDLFPPDERRSVGVGEGHHLLYDIATLPAPRGAHREHRAHVSASTADDHRSRCSLAYGRHLPLVKYVLPCVFLIERKCQLIDPVGGNPLTNTLRWGFSIYRRPGGVLNTYGLRFYAGWVLLGTHVVTGLYIQEYRSDMFTDGHDR